jgi:FtsH-binding integral membrane protein
MNERDNELQKLAEQHILTGDDRDARAYRLVFRSLAQQPSYPLRPDFADRVMARLMAIRERRALQKDYLWMGIGLSVLFLAAVVSVIITGFQFDTGVLTFLHHYKGLIIFGVAFVGLLHWIDRKVLSTNAR